tara:strand:- start:649 stop:1164 length:516 start_codon:yes stop_codon:yes gene_type:complete
MADSAKGRMSASVLLDSIKTKMSGKFDYLNPNLTNATSGGEGWIYAEKNVTTSSADLIGTTESFLGPSTTAADVASGDKVKYLVIEHTGYTDSTMGVSTTEGILLAFDGVALANDTPDALLIESGEIFMLKAPNTTVDNLHARTCVVSAGAPIGNGSKTAYVKIAAIIQNV